MGVPQSGKDAITGADRARTGLLPAHKHLLEQPRHGYVPRARSRLGQLRDGAVLLLHTTNTNDPARKVYVVPEQRELLARAEPGQEREGVVDTLAVVLERSTKQQADLVRRKNGLLRPRPAASCSRRHRRYAQIEVLRDHDKRGPQEFLGYLGGVAADMGGQLLVPAAYICGRQIADPLRAKHVKELCFPRPLPAERVGPTLVGRAQENWPDDVRRHLMVAAPRDRLHLAAPSLKPVPDGLRNGEVSSLPEIGRASCRERVELAVAAESL